MLRPSLARRWKFAKASCSSIRRAQLQFLKNSIHRTSFLAYSYVEALYRYLLSYPKGADGLPTVPAFDARYKSGGEGRITWQS